MRPNRGCLAKDVGDPNHPHVWLGRRHCSRPVVAVWLGAGGSGRTWSLTQVLRSLFQKSLPPQALLAVAPAHTAGRLLGKDAITLHKAGGAAFRQKWDEESLSLKGDPFTKARQRFEPKQVIVLASVLPCFPPSDHCAPVHSQCRRAGYMSRRYGKMPLESASETSSSCGRHKGARCASTCLARNLKLS